METLNDAAPDDNYRIFQKALSDDLHDARLRKNAFARDMEVTVTAINKWREIPEKRMRRAAELLGVNARALKLTRRIKLSRMMPASIDAAPPASESAVALQPDSDRDKVGLKEALPTELHAFLGVEIGFGSLRRRADYLSPSLVAEVSVADRATGLGEIARRSTVNLLVLRQLLGDPERPLAALIVTAESVATIPADLMADFMMLGVRVVCMKRFADAADFIAAHDLVRLANAETA